MSAYERALRTAAEKFKSFPDAVNAHLRNAFDRGATDVKISYLAPGQDGKVDVVMIQDNGRPLTEEQFVAITNPSAVPRDSYETLALTAVHHALMLSVQNNRVTRTVRFEEYDESKPERYKRMFPRVESRPEGMSPSEDVFVQFWFINAGSGVDPRQDRGAARLIKRLPAMLGTREAFKVTVVDENGASTRLGSDDSASKENGDHVVWVPTLKAAFDHGRPLLLQYGGVRVPIATILEKASAFVQRPWEMRRKIETLNSPWFTGVIEITRKDGATEFPDPLDDFPDEAYAGGLVHQLIVLLLATGVAETMYDEIVAAANALWRTVARNDGSFTYNESWYDLRVNVDHEHGEVVWGGAEYRNEQNRLGFDPLCPILQADGRSDLIADRLIWLVAHHLAHGGDARQAYLRLSRALRESRAS